MEDILHLGPIVAEVEFKAIKNVHLSVYPPEGRVRIAAPGHMTLKTVKAFALQKLAWIQAQQKQLREQDREPQREYLERESHWLWGKRYLLEIRTTHSNSRVEIGKGKLLLWLHPLQNESSASEIVEEFYRSQVRDKAEPLIRKWEKRMGVKVDKLFVQKMRTKWGSCSPMRSSIRLNTELAKKPRDCLEYLVVHEMTHLLEPTHNQRFRTLMDGYLPNWLQLRAKLNTLPVKHEDWGL